MPASIVKMYGDLMIFSGTANRPLAEATASHVGVALGGVDVQQFPNSNTFVRLHQSVRAKDVFVIQPTSAPVNDHLMELLIFIDTLKRELGGPHHGRGAVLRLWPHRQKGSAARPYHGVPGRRSDPDGGRRPDRHPRPARQAASRLFFHRH